jgi:hypothetical protein
MGSKADEELATDEQGSDLTLAQVLAQLVLLGINLPNSHPEPLRMAPIPQYKY